MAFMKGCYRNGNTQDQFLRKLLGLETRGRRYRDKYGFESMQVGEKIEVKLDFDDPRSDEFTNKYKTVYRQLDRVIRKYGYEFFTQGWTKKIIIERVR